MTDFIPIWQEVIINGVNHTKKAVKEGSIISIFK